MKRFFAAVLAVVMLATCFSGCANNAVEESNSPVKESSEVPVEPTEEPTGEEEVSPDANFPNSLALVGVENARMVAGLVTDDGRVVKENVLLRTGRLEGATETDIDRLVNEFNLTDIVDLRSESDAAKNPDPEIAGTNYHILPLYSPTLNESYIQLVEVPDDVMKEYELAVSGESDNPWHQKMEYVVFLSMGGSPEAYDSNFSKMMGLIAKDEYSQGIYKQVFDIILNAEGAVDIHCTAGKDRTGAIIALVLETIGCNRDDIINEYLLTNEYVADLIRAAEEAAIAEGLPEGYVQSQKIIQGVTLKCINNFFDTIDSEYGGVQAYVRNQLGLTDEDIETLKDKLAE